MQRRGTAASSSCPLFRHLLPGRSTDLWWARIPSEGRECSDSSTTLSSLPRRVVCWQAKVASLLACCPGTVFLTSADLQEAGDSVQVMRWELGSQ